jgi:hypothetical protein
MALDRYASPAEALGTRASADSASTETSAREQVDRIDLRVAALVGERLRARDERLRLRRVPVEVNRLLGRHAWLN